ncbi:amidohydrolase [Nakamurella sp. A5-74]|uniref:Amidohydrolase n=1 Tax=Nakamurella sp. A5-74 TaxID=3158264 RepID=A0AAU8DKP9_9ACTN
MPGWHTAVQVTDPGSGRGPEWLDDFLIRTLPALVAIRRDIHGHPELAWREHRTTDLIEARLTAASVPTRRLPRGTGLIAQVGTGAPVIGLRADIDALPLREASGQPFASTVPGVAHACGHDVHATVLLGAALALRHAAELGEPVGTIRLIFQPAEEVMPGGAREVIAAGGMAGVDRVFAVHCEPKVPAGRVGLRVGAITSTADQIEISVSGPGGHTSRPHLTADVVNALGLLITGLPLLLSRRLDPRAAAVLAWGSVHAGEAPNAIPQEGTLRGTLRLMRREAWEGAEAVVADIVAGLLAPTGVGYELHFQRGVPPVDNDAYATALLRAGALAGLGPDSVVESEQSTGAEDFADLLEHAPGALARLGVWDGVSEQCDLHSAGFTADERSIASGIRLLVHTVLAARRGP